MLLFTVTGVTLNHASSIPAKPVTKEVTYTLPVEYLKQIAIEDQEEKDKIKPLPSTFAAHLGSQFDVKLRNKDAEWSAEEIYLSLPRPGGDAWMSIDRRTGEVIYEKTSRGMISFLNDLHKGRHTGLVWFWFIDVFSFAAIIFTLTGLGLLWVHGKRRPSTWPLVIAGVILPIVIILVFIH